MKRTYPAAANKRGLYLLLTIVTAFVLNSCKHDLVTIRYQHLANFQEWDLGGEKGHDQIYRMGHVYMLKDVSNKDSKAKPFKFSAELLQLGAASIGSGWQPMKAAQPYTIPLNFSEDLAPGELFTIPAGKAKLFIILDDGEPGKTDLAPITYAKKKGRSVLTVMMDSKARVPFGVLNQAFLNNILQMQKVYEQKP